MTELTGSKGNYELLKKKFLKQLASGEKISAAHFEMEFADNKDLTIRIEATQIPAIKRTLLEGFGAMGNKVNQQGNIENAGEFTVTMAENLKGDVLKYVKKAVREKLYTDITIRLTPESNEDEPTEEVKLLHCFVGSDVIDLANESVTEFVRPPLVINYGWIDLEEE